MEIQARSMKVEARPFEIEMRKESSGSPVHSYLPVWMKLGILNDFKGSLITLDTNRLVIPKKY